MLSLLLPLLLEVIATGSRHRVEQVFGDSIRARVRAGWTVVEVSSQNDGIAVTIAKGEAHERHVARLGNSNTYEVETEVPAPAELDEQSPFLMAAFDAPGGGGVELRFSCGDPYLRPYVVEDHANQEFAPSLIARTLAGADNLYNVEEEAGRVTFVVVRRAVERELVVWVDKKGTVIEAQLRRFEHGNGGGSYERMRALKQAVAKSRVTAIVGGALVTPTSRFTIDPAGSGFSYDHGEGCGC